MDKVSAQKIAEIYSIEKIKQIVADCPPNCSLYRECVGDTIIRQIPISVFQDVLVLLGHEFNSPKEQSK